ncbi:MAG: glycosyl transferase, partial [Alphaproteobacteria bacterium RIFOXYD12_FULL_60_8]
VAEKFTDRIFEGDWAFEGDRRNAAIAHCRGEWVFEIDADERVPRELAEEIRATIESSSFDWHEILVDNYIGDKLVRHGWGASFGKAAYPGLFRKGAKTWGRQRVHPSLVWKGRKGPMLTHRIDHFVDRNISDMIRRLDNYSTARAKDLRDSGDIGSFANNLRRLISRFVKCYVGRQGYKEGGYGFLIALFAGLFPLLSHLKAKLEKD